MAAVHRRDRRHRESMPDSRGHELAEVGDTGLQLLRRARACSRRARRGVIRGHGPSSNACVAARDRPVHVGGLASATLKYSSSLAESITSIIGRLDGAHPLAADEELLRVAELDLRWGCVDVMGGSCRTPRPDGPAADA